MYGFNLSHFLSEDLIFGKNRKSESFSHQLISWVSIAQSDGLSSCFAANIYLDFEFTSREGMIEINKS